MKLSTDQIAFIDIFLKRNNVMYVDIRAEMIDHIASGVEEKMQNEKIEFYDAFRSYLFQNKKEVFKLHNNTSNWVVSLLEMKQFLSFLLRPKNLVVLLILAVFFKVFESNIYFLRFKDSLFSFFVILFGITITIQFVYFFLIKKKRFYFIEKNSKTLMFIYFLSMFILKPYNNGDIINNYSLLIFIYVLICFSLYMGNEIRAFVKSKLYTL